MRERGSREAQVYCFKAVEYFPEDAIANMHVRYPLVLARV
jgi:hypothetical protein